MWNGPTGKPGVTANRGLAKARPPRRYSLLCFPTDRAAYGRLSELISLGQRRAEKGKCRALARGRARPRRRPDPRGPAAGADRRRIRAFSNRLRAASSAVLSGGAASLSGRRRPAHRGAGGARRRAAARRWSPPATCSTTRRSGGRSRTCSPASASTRTIDEAGYRLEANAERHLKPRSRDGAPVRAAIPTRWRARSRSPTPAASPWTSCATSTRSTRRPRA